MVENLVLLSKHEYKTPQIRDQPGVNRLIAPVRGHQDFGHHWQKALQRKLEQVLSQRVFVNVHDLVRTIVAVHFQHLVPEIHSFAVGMLDALLNVAKKKSLFPSKHPLFARIHRFALYSFHFLCYCFFLFDD